MLNVDISGFMQFDEERQKKVENDFKKTYRDQQSCAHIEILTLPCRMNEELLKISVS